MNSTYWLAASPQGIAGDRARSFTGTRTVGLATMPVAMTSPMGNACVTATSNHKHERPLGLEGTSPG